MSASDEEFWTVTDDEKQNCTGVACADARGGESATAFDEEAQWLRGARDRCLAAAVRRTALFTAGSSSGAVAAFVEEVEAASAMDWQIYFLSFFHDEFHGECTQAERCRYEAMLREARVAWMRSFAPLVEFARSNAGAIDWKRLSRSRSAFTVYAELVAMTGEDLPGIDGPRALPMRFAEADAAFEVLGRGDARRLSAELAGSDDPHDATLSLGAACGHDLRSAVTQWGRLRGTAWGLDLGTVSEPAWIKGFAEELAASIVTPQ